VAPPGFVPIARLTLPPNPVAVLPNWSRAVTCTAGVIGAPATVLVGWAVKKRALTGAAVMLNPVEVTAGRPAAAALSV
jgi:hypothetical protein